MAETRAAVPTIMLGFSKAKSYPFTGKKYWYWTSSTNDKNDKWWIKVPNSIMFDWIETFKPGKVVMVINGSIIHEFEFVGIYNKKPSYNAKWLEIIFQVGSVTHYARFKNR